MYPNPHPLNNMMTSAMPPRPRTRSTRGGYRSYPHAQHGNGALATHGPQRSGPSAYTAQACHGAFVDGVPHAATSHNNNSNSSHRHPTQQQQPPSLQLYSHDGGSNHQHQHHHNNHNHNSGGSVHARMTPARPLKKLLHHEIALVMLLFSMQSFFERSFGVGGPLSTELIAGTRFGDYARPSFASFSSSSSSSWWWWRQQGDDGFFASSASFVRDGGAAERASLLDAAAQYTQLPLHKRASHSGNANGKKKLRRKKDGADDSDEDVHGAGEGCDDGVSDAPGTRRHDGDGADATAAARERCQRFATNEDIWDNIFGFLPWREVLRMRGLSTTHFRCSLAYVAICRMPYTHTPACFIPVREDFDADEAAVEAALQPQLPYLHAAEEVWCPMPYATTPTTAGSLMPLPLPPPLPLQQQQQQLPTSASCASLVCGEAMHEDGGEAAWWTRMESPTCARSRDGGGGGGVVGEGGCACGCAGDSTDKLGAAGVVVVEHASNNNDDGATANAVVPYEHAAVSVDMLGDATPLAQRMFFGQLRRDGTVPMVRWLVHYVFDAPPWALQSVENHRHRRTALGKGCAWPTLTDPVTVSRLLDAHHRLFYDQLEGGVEGVWLVPHAHMHALAEEVAHRYVGRAHPRHMPRATFVAELSASAVMATGAPYAPPAITTTPTTATAAAMAMAAVAAANTIAVPLVGTTDPAVAAIVTGSGCEADNGFGNSGPVTMGAAAAAAAAAMAPAYTCTPHSAHAHAPYMTAMPPPPPLLPPCGCASMASATPAAAAYGNDYYGVGGGDDDAELHRPVHYAHDHAYDDGVSDAAIALDPTSGQQVDGVAVAATALSPADARVDGLCAHHHACTACNCAAYAACDDGVGCAACEASVVAAETASVASSNDGNSDAAASTLTTTVATAEAEAGVSAPAVATAMTSTAAAVSAPATAAAAAAASVMTPSCSQVSLPSYECAMSSVPYTPHSIRSLTSLRNAAITVMPDGRWRNDPYKPILLM